MDHSDGARSLYIRGLAAFKDGSPKEARFFFEWVLRESCTHDQRLRALYYLSELADTPEEGISFLEEILIADPSHPEARRKLAILRGQLHTGEIIQPDQAPRTRPVRIEKTKSSCTGCGGRMVFTPDGRSLECERCGKRFSAEPEHPPAAHPEGEDFVVTLAQSKGHTAPNLERAVSCPSCGAVLDLPENNLSHTCLYCGADYVPRTAQATGLIKPHALLPFSVSVENAFRAANEWRAQNGFLETTDPSMLNGVYLPVWGFEVEGKMRRCSAEGGRVLAEWPIQHPLVLVPATRSISKKLFRTVSACHLQELTPYDPSRLATWTTELYQISPADASLDARQIVVRAESARNPQTDTSYLSSSELSISLFRQLLLPFWDAHYPEGGNILRIIINGQTGAAAGEMQPRSSVINK